MKSLKIRRISAVMLCAAMMMSCMSIPSRAEEAEETETASCAHVHTFVRQEVGQAVTCEENGYHTAVTVCEDCGEELERERITDPAPGHAYKSTEKEPTCTEDGKIVWTCARCGDRFSEKGKEKLGHQYEVSARTEPTFEKEGSVTWTCARCGDSRTESLPKTEKPVGEPEREEAARNASEEEAEAGAERSAEEKQDGPAGGEAPDEEEEERTGDGQEVSIAEAEAVQPKEKQKQPEESAPGERNKSGSKTAGSESGLLPVLPENEEVSVDPGSARGMVTAVSGGLVSRISVVWNDGSPDGGTLLIYGRGEAYESAEDLYDSARRGVLLGTIVRGENSELKVSGDYAYFGILPADGKLCVESIAVDWR